MFYTTNDILLSGLIANTIPVNKIIPIMDLTEKLNIKQLLTEPLYNDILNQIETDTKTAETDLLLIEMKTYYIHVFLLNYIKINGSFITNQGNGTYNGTNFEANDDAKNNNSLFRRNTIVNDLKDQFQNWLIENRNSYPLFVYNCNQNQTNNNGGLYLF